MHAGVGREIAANLVDVAVDQKVCAEARSVGRDVAARWADRVDAEARFPAETVAALRASGLLGALVPLEWGGPGASMQEMVEAVVILAEHCGSSGLVLAMHQIQVASVVRHGSASACELVLPRLVAGQLLLANANSEVGLGGNRRSSICALEPSPGGFRLEKQASTVSYGEDADCVLATARRTPESPPDDQVLAVCLPPDLHVEPRGDWNTLGLRGTCSKPCQLTAEIPPELVIADYADVFTRTALPLSSVLLSAVWLGIAEAAAQRAHASVRARARELLVRKHSPLPCRRIKASTSAAPGVSTSPVHTQPSRSKTKPCISRRARRGGLMVGGRILTRGPRARGTAAAPALSKLWVRGRSR